MLRTSVGELREISSRLKAFLEDPDAPRLSARVKAVQNGASEVGNAWSGSWIGYHSRVYYDGLRTPPPGAHFSSEWGLRETVSPGTRGDWKEFEPDRVKEEVFRRAGNPDLEPARLRAELGTALASACQDQITSILEVVGTQGDRYLADSLEVAKKVAILTAGNFILYARPAGLTSRDSLAMAQGYRTPPHIEVFADCEALLSPDLACKDLERLSSKAADHLERKQSQSLQNKPSDGPIFIGHGRSPLWKGLKDFLHDRLRLPWDEFNRISPAGLSTVSRLQDMIDRAAFAFLVMTAEDEHVDGRLHPRENVIHEAGLFQGRLGFTKAIILLEEGCDEFSNVVGLGQVRFPKGNIEACFEDIRRVLEREGFLTSGS